ncbi:MAG: hypothetical protein DCC57_12730, partial [Chloroflexi bacterium]
GARCGQGQTRLVDGQVVYQVDVAGAAAGCGLDGQRVRFSVGGRTMRPQGVWGNQTVQELALAPQPRTPGPEPEGGDVYLPVALQGAAAPPQPRHNRRSRPCRPICRCWRAESPG